MLAALEGRGPGFGKLSVLANAHALFGMVPSFAPPLLLFSCKMRVSPYAA